MLNYLNGFLTSMLIIGSFFLITGAKYGGSQHFGDIIANSITITDKNGFGGVFKVVDKDGNTLLSIKNGNINIFNDLFIKLLLSDYLFYSIILCNRLKKWQTSMV